MKKQRRTLVMLLCVILCVCLFALPVMAQTTTQDGMEVTLTTDKAEYAVGEDITATLTVKNTSAETFKNLKLEHLVPEDFEGTGETSKEVAALAAGKSASIAVTYACSASAVGGVNIWLIVIVGVMVVAAVVLVVLLVRNKKLRAPGISMLLCCVLVSGLVLGAVPAGAATVRKNVTVSTDVTVGGEKLTLKGKVSWEVPDDPTQPTNPTEPTSPTEPTDPTNPDDPTQPTDPAWNLGEYGPVQSKNVATAEEIARTEAYYQNMVGDISLIPVSFKLDGVAYQGFSGDAFALVSNVQSANEDQSQLKNVITVEHKDSGLLFEVTAVLYRDYAAYEFVTYISNPTEKNSPVISDLLALNETYVGSNPTLLYSEGDSVGHYEPLTEHLNGAITFAPLAGRSTEGAFPYYKLNYGTGGMILAIGWAGQWEATFDNSADASRTAITAGQQEFHAYLMPGEVVRTPSISIINYEGQDDDRITNLWRRWYIDNIMYRVKDEEGNLQLPEPATHIYGKNSNGWLENVGVTEQSIIEGAEYLKELGIVDFSKYDLYNWLDAGWYFDADEAFLGSGNFAWQTVGTWDFDTNRFPTEMREATERLYELGFDGYVLWFEPERFTISVASLKDDGTTAKKEWIIGETMFDLSNDEATEWMLNRILSVMAEGGFTLYREDMNLHTPLGNWQMKDALLGENRTGITENKYIQNHFYMWEKIAEATNNPIDACASGGNRLDLDTMRYAISLHPTDYSYSDMNIQQCYGQEMFKWFPYFQQISNPTSRYSYRLRFSLFYRAPGFDENGVYIDYDLFKDVWAEWEQAVQYMYSDYYELFPYSTSGKDWMGYQFFNETRGEGFALIERRSDAAATRTVALKGLEPDRKYHVWFEDRGQHAIYTGQELMNGIQVTLPTGESSDILWISQTYRERGLTASVTRTALSGMWGDAIQEVDGTYNRFDIRFNRSILDTVLAAGKGILAKEITNDAVFSQILINGKTLAEMVRAGDAYVHYDASNIILQVYIKKSAVDISRDVSLVLTKDLANFEGYALGEDISLTYSASAKAWGKTGTDIQENPVLDMYSWVDPENFENPLNLTEETLSVIKFSRPWEYNKSGVFSWSYSSAANGATSDSYAVFKLTKDAAHQYGDGKQSIIVYADRMKTGNDYFLDIAMQNLEPGQYMTAKFMVYCGLSDVDDVIFSLRNENNASGGSMGNYIVTGTPVKDGWAEYTISWVAAPDGNGMQIMKFAFYPQVNTPDGYILIDQITIQANEMKTEVQSQYQFEDAVSPGKIPYLPSYSVNDATPSGFYTWDWPTVDYNAFTVENGEAYGAKGNVIVADLDNAERITIEEWSGYFLYYVFDNMQPGSTYYLNFRVKGMLATDLLLAASPERNFYGDENGNTCVVQGFEYECDYSNSEWTNVRVAFTAQPLSNGRAALRLVIRPSFGKSGSGKIVLDDFTLEKSLFNVDEFGTIAYTTPWEFSSGKEEDYSTWAYDAPGDRIFSWVTDGYDGNAIRGVLENAVPSTGLDGSGYYLDYWLGNLEAGKTYKLTFAYKNQLSNATFNVANEGNGGGTVVMNTKNLPATADWKTESVIFTTQSTEATHWSLRFAVYLGKAGVSDGSVALDILSIEEYVVPEDPAKPTAPAVDGTYAEDEATTVGHYAGPWELPSDFAGGFYTWQQEGFAPRFEVVPYGNAALGNYLKLNVTNEEGLSGHLVLDYFIPNLKANGAYELVLYVKATDGINFGHIQLRKEHSYGTITVPSEVTFMDFSSEWTKVAIPFTAYPDANTGLCAVAIDFYPGEGAVEGCIYLDGIHVEEVERVVIIDDSCVDYYNGPWEFSSTEQEYFVSWTHALEGKNVYSYDADGSIIGEVEDVNGTTDGAGYLPDYWVSSLTAGKTYEMKIRYKNELVNGIFVVENEPNGGGGVTINSSSILASASEWTEATIRFTAEETADTHWSFRFSLYVTRDPDLYTSGSIALDILSIEEYVVPEDPAKPTAPAVDGTHAEDETTEVGHYNGPWELPSDFAGGFYTWQQDGFAPRFKVVPYGDAALGNYLKLDVTNDAGLSGHLVLDYFVPGLKENGQYELVLYVKATDGINFGHIQLRKEHSYGTITVSSEVAFTDFSSEWTKVTIPFTASPDANTGLCAIAIDFYPGEGAVEGCIYLDGIHVEEVEGLKTPVAYYNGPWEFNSTDREYFVSWAHALEGKNVYVYDDDGSIIGEVENVNGTTDGAGYLLDYWVSGLTAGKTYEMKIRYKNELVNGNFVVENEPNGGGGVTIDGGSVTLANASAWTEATIRFTAEETADTHWSFRFALYVTKDSSLYTSGSIALDVVSIEEYAEPVAVYAEDGIASVPGAAPWELSSTFTGGFVTWTQSGNVPAFSVESLAEGDNTIKIDVNGKTGGINMDWYIAGLTSGQKYTISFMVKASADINWGSIVLRNEHSFGHGAVTSEVEFTAFSPEWTKVKVEFTAANDPTMGLSALCFDFRAPSEGEGVGTIWIDQVIATPIG